MDTLFQDIRYATRKLLRTPSFTLIAVVTLALGIGATTAMWAIVDGVLLRPLPYPDPERVVQVASIGREGKPQAMSALDFIDYRDQSKSFAGMAAMDDGNENLIRAGVEPVRIPVATVGANFFDILGLRPQKGRYFVQGEDVKGAARVVVLSDKLWKTTFAEDPAIVGKIISLNGNLFTVIGIAPERFNYPDRVEAWRPLIWADWMIDPGNRGAHWLAGIGRVKPGVPVATAKQEVVEIGKRLALQYPESNKIMGGSIEPLQETIVGPVAKALKAMLGAVVFVLLIACANVANLLLVRAATRETEMAVRTALGAGRGRIIRQLVTESALLAVAGAGLGMAIASWILVGVTKLAGNQVPRLDDVRMDAGVFAFAAGVAILTGVLFGLVPALHAARSGIGQMLRAGSRGMGGPGANRTRSTLVIAELALAMVLLIGAGLLTRSFSRLLSVDPGFKPDSVTSFRVSLPTARYPNEADAQRFTTRVLAELKQLPGTRDAAATYFRPFEQGIMRTSFDVRGEVKRPSDQRMLSIVMPTSPEFFRTMGIPVKAGRTYDESENGFRGEPVVVVNEALVRKYFPTTNPIGKYLTYGIGHDTAPGKPSMDVQGRIIGIVGNVHQRDLKTDPYPMTYIPYNTYPTQEMAFVVRTSSNASTVGAAARARIRQIDPELPVYGLQTMEDAMSASASQQRFFMALLVGFAGLALTLAAIGIYGVISYSVAQRTREMGIRIALGATQQRVMKLVVSQGATLALAGVGLGAAGALSLTRVIQGLLFNTSALDLPTFAGVGALLAGIAIVAAYMPARRAAKVDPVTAMRAD
jgi:putative ABC transport system permease protein